MLQLRTVATGTVHMFTIDEHLCAVCFSLGHVQDKRHEHMLTPLCPYIQLQCMNKVSRPITRFV